MFKKYDQKYELGRLIVADQYRRQGNQGPNPETGQGSLDEVAFQSLE